jgi:hypothetical protein
MVSCTNCKNITLNKNSIEKVSSDGLILRDYNWSKCITNKDTVIVLSRKDDIIDLQESDKKKLIKINYINDEIGYRFYRNDLFIDGKLAFPKRMNVYLSCKK